MTGPNAAQEREKASASDRGADPDAAFSLGGLLAERGDLAAAAAAYLRADEHGHGAAASNLGMLLEEQGDLEGAEAAYRRADARGDAAGAFNLGALLAERGDLVGASIALCHAAAGTDATAAKIAREALLSLGVSIHHEGAENDTTEVADITPTVTSHTRRGGDSDIGGRRGHGRNGANLLLLLLIGVGVVMIALGVAGLAEGRTDMQVSSPRATAPSLTQTSRVPAPVGAIEPVRGQQRARKGAEGDAAGGLGRTSPSRIARGTSSVSHSRRADSSGASAAAARMSLRNTGGR
jgi:hypothetical protein